MGDAAAHLHVASLLHDWDISLLVRERYVQPELVLPGVAWYRVAGWLAWIGGIEWGVRVLLSLSVALLPVAALYLLQALGQSRWLVLALMPWALNARFFAGDLPFLASMPLFIVLLVAHIRLLRRPRLSAVMLTAGLMLALALTHHLLWLLALFLLPALAAWMGSDRGWRQALIWPLREALIVLPSVALLLPWLMAQWTAVLHPLAPQSPVIAASLAGTGENLYAAVHSTPIASIRQLLQQMFARFSATSGEVSNAMDLLVRRPGELASSLWLLGIVFWTVAMWRSRTGPATDTEQSQKRHRLAYVVRALALVFITYILWPQELSRPLPLGAMNIRLVPILVILAVASLPLAPLTMRPRLRVWALAGSAAMLVCAVGYPLQTTGSFMLAGADHGSMRRALTRIPSGHNVLTLTQGDGSRWLKGRVWRDSGAWYAVYQGGYAPSDFARLGLIPLAERPDRVMPRPTTAKQADFKLKEHGRYYDYVVIRRASGAKPGPWELALKGWHRVYHRDRWQVHQNPQPAEWPVPGDAELRLRTRSRRITELLLGWIGMGIPDDRDLDARSYMGMLGIELPEPSLPPPDPVPADPEPPDVGIHELEAIPSPEPVMVPPDMPSLPITVSPGMMPNIAPPAMVPMLRPLFGPELHGIPEAGRGDR